MMDTKLILLEGIPGSGKSTMAHKTALILNKKRIPHCLYREGCLHPANLDGYAVMSAAEFEKLIKQFPQHEGRIRSHSLEMEEPNMEAEGHTMEMVRHILVQRQKDSQQEGFETFMEHCSSQNSYVNMHHKKEYIQCISLYFGVLFG